MRSARSRPHFPARSSRALDSALRLVHTPRSALVTAENKANCPVAHSALRIGGAAEENHVGVGVPTQDGQILAIGRPSELVNVPAGEMGEQVAARAIKRLNQRLATPFSCIWCFSIFPLEVRIGPMTRCGLG